MIGLINHVFIQLVFSEVWISLFWYQILTCFILLVHFPVHFCSYREKFISLYCRLSAVVELDSLNTQQSLREAISDSEVAAAKQRHQQVLDFTQVTICFIWGERRKGQGGEDENHEWGRTAVWAKDHYVQTVSIWLLNVELREMRVFKQRLKKKPQINQC